MVNKPSSLARSLIGETKDFRIPNPQLLRKHGLTLDDFNTWWEACAIRDEINIMARQYYGASLSDRSFLSSKRPYSQVMAEKFKSKHGVDWEEMRASLLDRINDYADEFWGFPPRQETPNGRRFW